MNKDNKTAIALFDFDGTITNKDSLIEFIRFSYGSFRFYVGLLFLSPVVMLFLMKIISNTQLKIFFFHYFLKGWSEAYFSKKAKDYSDKILPNIIKQSALDRIKWHHDRGHKVLLVSASVDQWLKFFCEKYDMELIATRLEVVDGHFTGNFETENCFGQEKVNRVKQCYNLEEFDEIYAYGDSSGDKEMLEIADHPHYRFFR